MGHIRILFLAQVLIIGLGYCGAASGAAGKPQDLELQKVDGVQTVVSVGKLPRNALVRIRISRASTNELGVWMYDPVKKELLNGAAPAVCGRRVNPAKVWQASLRDPASNRLVALQRLTRTLTEGDVVEYRVRDYSPSEERLQGPAGLAINSAECFLLGGKSSSAVSLTQKADVYTLVLDDGWELEVRIVMPSL